MKVADIIKFSKLCNKYGIAIRFGIMVGIPGEKSKDLKLTLNLIKNIYKINEDNKVLVFFFTPYPGTRLYDLIVEKYGFEVPKSLIEWSKLDASKMETKWVDKLYKKKVYTFLFYLELAFLDTPLKEKVNKSRYKLLYMLVHKIALFRLNHNFLEFPIERKLWVVYKRFA